jgi:hypothetical protein
MSKKSNKKGTLTGDQGMLTINKTASEKESSKKKL